MGETVCLEDIVKKRKVVLIDAMNLYIRNFCAVSLTNSNGDHVGGLFGCLQSFKKIVDSFNPDIVIVAWEGKNSTKRRKELSRGEYKEGRKFTGFNRMFAGDPEGEKQAFNDQMTRVKDYLMHLPFYQASVEFLEADDVIGYVVRNIFNDPEDFFNVIVSYDRDFYQLISNNTIQFRPVKTKKAPLGQLLDVDGVFEETGLHPHHHILSKCVCGDKSDNINGIKGVGEKTFAKDFPMLGSLKSNGDIYGIQDVLDIADHKITVEKKNKYSKYLLHRDLLEKNYKLMQLLDPDISSAARRSIERIITQSTPKFNQTQFRLMLESDQISPRRVLSWVDSMTNVHPLKIILE